MIAAASGENALYDFLTNIYSMHRMLDPVWLLGRDNILEKRIFRQRRFGIQQMSASWAGEAPQHDTRLNVAARPRQFSHRNGRK
jgi:hypothetical protein